MTVNGLFTSESVTEGHPDKVADQIAGEITASGSVDHERIARQTVRRIGYTDPALGFHDGCEVQVRLVAQSGDIARGVTRDPRERAGREP